MGRNLAHQFLNSQHRHILITITLIAALIALFASFSAAAESSPWLLRVGAHNVAPKSDNHSIVEVDDATMLTFNLTRFLNEHWAVELLAAAPFKHDIDLVSGGKVAETKHLPPTLSAQYHFNPGGKIRPYVGAGINVTLFFEEDTTGVLAASDLSLDTSVGAAAQLGMDFDITEKLFVNAEVRYIQIETKAKLDSTSLGDVEIDPWVFGVSLGLRL